MRQKQTGLLAAVLAVVLFAPAAWSATPRGPEQPTTGPGGSEYAHTGVRTSGPFFTRNKREIPANRYFLYEPVGPVPDTAPVVLFLHGFGATDPAIYSGWITHIVRKGYVVVWVQYQANGPLTPPGQFPGNAAAAWIDALGRLQTGVHVRPERNEVGGFKTAIVGHSMGGYLSVVLAANSANALNGMPTPYAVVSIEPGGKNVLPPQDLGAILPDTKLVVVAGDEDGIVCIDTAVAVWAETAQIPDENRDFLFVLTDRHGSPPQRSDHFFPTSNPAAHPNATNARDFFITWKLSVAALNCGFDGTDCSYALGDGAPEQLNTGVWSDGVPITPMIWVEDPSQLQATCQGN